MGDLLQLKDLGGLLPNQDAETFRDRLADVLQRNKRNFPGAQPVSFSRKHLAELRKEDYYLCEKTDGIRCLLFLTYLVIDGAKVKANFLIDRKNDYYFVQNPNLNLPLPGKGPDSYHTDTLLDGELVLDTEKDGSTVKRYLVFDCLALDGRPLLERPLSKRIGHAYESILKPYNDLLKADPPRRFRQPFEVLMKKMEKAYGTEMMFRDMLPALKHGNDGLIFTCVGSQYTPGTDPHIIKWKPPHENTVDFRLQMGAFPPLSPSVSATQQDGDQPLNDPNDDNNDVSNSDTIVDYDAIPQLSLLAYHGNKPAEVFAELDVSAAEWTAMKALNQMLDHRIIECYRDAATGRWRPKTEKHNGAPRFRDDKTEANHISVVHSVLESIEDAVSEQDLVVHARGINVAWKERERVARARAEAANSAAVEDEERRKREREKARGGIGGGEKPAGLEVGEEQGDGSDGES